MAQRPNLRWHMQPADRDLRHIWNTKLIVFEKPKRGYTYVIGADVSQGRGKDRSVAQVLRVGTLTEPDMQVAEFATDTLQPKAFAEVLASLGRLYNGQETEALIIVERNTAGGGDLTLEDLRFRWDYGHLYTEKRLDSLTNVWTATIGWHTGNSNRAKLTLAFKEAVENGDLLLHSPLLLGEMETFEGDGFIAKAQAASGQFDDRVMAMALAHWAAHEEEWLLGDDTARRRAARRPLTTSEHPADTDATPARRVDFQNTDATVDDYNDYGDSLAGQYGWL